MNEKIVELSLSFKLLNDNIQSNEPNISFISEINRIQLSKEEVINLLGGLYEYFESYPEEV